MKKLLVVVVALSVVVGACGSSGGGNAALDKSFTYGSSSDANEAQADVMESSLDGFVSFKSSPSASGAMSIGAGSSSVTTTLLGANPFGSYVGGLQQAEQMALTAVGKALGVELKAVVPAQFSEEDECVTETETSVVFHNCTEDLSESGMTGTLSLNGSATLTDDQTVAWDITMRITMSGSSGGVTVSVNASVDYSGNLTVTSTTIVGDMLYKMSVKANAAGQSMSIGMAEALILDLTYDSTPCVDGGTLEAKRVWTAVPDGFEQQAVDVAAKVTWTDCGEATIQISVD